MIGTDHFFIATTLTCSKCNTAKREIMNNKVLLCPSCGSYIIIKTIAELHEYLKYKA